MIIIPLSIANSKICKVKLLTKKAGVIFDQKDSQIKFWIQNKLFNSNDHKGHNSGLLKTEIKTRNVYQISNYEPVLIETKKILYNYKR